MSDYCLEQPMELIDWYDGIVQAIISTKRTQGQFLCSLLAFNVESRNRVFALLPLEDVEVSNIRSRLGGDWNELLSYLKRLWHSADGDITLLCALNGVDVIAETIVDARILKDQTVNDIEEAVSDSREKWFDLFPSTL